MKNLVIGDPHIRVQDLEEADRLYELIAKTAQEQEVDVITFMGDLFHTHALVHVEVMVWWRDTLEALAARWPVIVVKGNHDGPQEDRAGVHALVSLEMENVTIVAEPTKLHGMLFVPFIRDDASFVNVCRKNADLPVMYCHQEFNGCKYDNGFYSKVGVDPDLIPQTLVISGHIHTGQEFGKVWYVGAPRWMTASDANQDRFLWVVEHDDAGSVTKRSPFPTDSACVRMVIAEDRPEKPLALEDLPKGCKAMVDIHGSAERIEERKRYWQGRARIRTFATDERQLVVKESDGIPLAFKKFMNAYEPKFGVPKNLLEQVVHDRLGI